MFPERGLIEAAIIGVHVLAGITSLVMAPVAMLTTKGGKAHRRWGNVYFWGMAVIFFTALLLIFYRFNLFLLGVTFLSFYNAFSGVRSLKRKTDPTALQPIDWFALITSLIVGGGLALYSAGMLLNIWPEGFVPEAGTSTIAGMLGIIFGVLTFQSAWADLQMVRTPPTDKRWWWYHHMGQMGGSYIGTLTAFAVQQISPALPESIAWMVWLLPTVIGVPALSYWAGWYRRKFEAVRRRRASAA